MTKKNSRTLFALGLFLFGLAPSSQAREVFEIGSSTIDALALNFPVDNPSNQYGSTKFGTTINGRTHQQWPMQTFKGYQYATYYDQDRFLCVARRKLPSGDWEVIRFNDQNPAGSSEAYDYRIENNDSHNVTVIGIAEGDGSIHLAYDHHKSDLNYRRTAAGVATNPESVVWSKELFTRTLNQLGPITSIEPGRDRIIDFTYPRFVPMPNGNMLLYFRYVTSGNGDSYIFEYDANTSQWKEGLGKFIARDKGNYLFDRNGDGQIASDRSETSPFRYAYINAISYAGSRLHVSWIWRDVFTGTSLDGNHDLCYAYSDDDGKTWRNNAGDLVSTTGTNAKDTLITIDTPGMTVVPIPPLSNAINQCTHYAYPDGSIHVMLRHYVSGTSTTRYHHHWRDTAGQWHTQALDFSGSRPTLVGDSDKNLTLVYTNGNRTQIAFGVPNEDKTAWTWNQAFTQNNFNDGGSGVIDFSRWQNEQILSTYAQGASPDPSGSPTPLNVIDYKIAAGPILDATFVPDANEVHVSWLSNEQKLQKQEGQLSPEGWEFVPEGTASPIVIAAQDAATAKFFRLATPPAPAVFKRFDWESGSENVTLKHLESSVSGGILTLTFDPTLHDPYIRMNDGSLDADIYKHLRLRVRNQTAGTNWLAFFSPEGGGESGNSINFSPTANSDWETIEIDMSADPDWQGTINTIRFDFDTFQSGTVQIDYIEIYR